MPGRPGRQNYLSLQPCPFPDVSLATNQVPSMHTHKFTDVMPSQITYWTDSTTVLSYIKSRGTRLHTFVANRFAEIKEVSDPEAWRHVPGRLNVADDCSRGHLSAQNLLRDSRWIDGPDLLLRGEDYWPNQVICQPPTDNDPEVKSEAWLGLSSGVNHEFLDPKKTSSWTHLTRVTAWVFRFVTSCRHRNEHVEVTKGPLSVEELVRAEEF